MFSGLKWGVQGVVQGIGEGGRLGFFLWSGVWQVNR